MDSTTRARGAAGGPTAAAREAWLRILTLFTGEEQTRAFLGTASELGLTPAGLRALLTLVPGEARAMGALASRWHCDASHVTGIVDQLEQRGYAARRAHAGDRRVRAVCLTAEGVAARERAREHLSAPPQGIAGLSSDEQEVLRDLLRKATDPPPG